MNLIDELHKKYSNNDFIVYRGFVPADNETSATGLSFQEKEPCWVIKIAFLTKEKVYHAKTFEDAAKKALGE